MFSDYERKLKYMSGKPTATFVNAEGEIVIPYDCDETVYTRKIRVRDRIC